MTNDLKKLIKSELNMDRVKEVYYQLADDEALYPHIVFDLHQINLLADDNNRRDYRIVIDVWDKGTSTTVVDDIADAIDKRFNALNAPQDAILPTFYIESNYSVLDEDKNIKHRQLKIIAQNYER